MENTQSSEVKRLFDALLPYIHLTPDNRRVLMEICTSLVYENPDLDFDMRADSAYQAIKHLGLIKA
ncbi:MAG: hypothetical protein ACK41O_16545 [Runella zeae]